jgi:hypothetical protein
MMKDTYRTRLLEFAARRCIAELGLRQRGYQFFSASNYRCREGKVTVTDILVGKGTLGWYEYNEDFEMKNHRSFEIKSFDSLLNDFFGFTTRSRRMEQGVHHFRQFGLDHTSPKGFRVL